jgi:hypothetical protein
MSKTTNEKRGGAFEVKGIRTGDLANEGALRGGAGASKSSTDSSVAGGEFSPSKAKDGYPQPVKK